MSVAISLSRVPRLELTLSSAQSLVDDLGYFGQSVGPRTGSNRRRQEDKEDYCLRRWLVAATAKGLLSFPMSIRAYERDHAPDFVASWSDSAEQLGIEVTEAGESSWQSWLTKTERQSTTLLPNQGGYAGLSIEEGIVRQVLLRIEDKILNADRYAHVGRCDLLIYENCEGGFMADPAAVMIPLSGELGRQRERFARAFNQIHLILRDNVYLNLLGNDFIPVDLSQLRGTDWAGWLATQAAKLRAHSMVEIDSEGLAEELEALSVSELRSLESHMLVVLLHLLKSRYQPSHRTASWENSIAASRSQIESLLEQSPSLLRKVEPRVAKIYERARRSAAKETGLSADAFPDECPFTFGQIIDPDFSLDAGSAP